MPSPTPLISVALCTYNGAHYLREQLDSVLAQTGVAIEVVAVDDGSSDATPAILEDYALRDPRLRWQANECNIGPTASFEHAMSRCTGEFIAPCDQDDIWLPEKLARLLAAIGEADLAYCDSEFMTADGQSMQRRLSEGLAMLQGTSPIGFLFTNTVSGHASLLRRDLFESARPFPAGAYHDWWLALCAAGRHGVRYLDQLLVRYRRHSTAYSPMGTTQSSRDAASSREWLDHRLRLMRAYAESAFREGDVADSLAKALQCAREHDRKARFMRLLWSHRSELPRWKGIPTLDALKWQLRFAKKLRRARRGANMTRG